MAEITKREDVYLENKVNQIIEDKIRPLRRLSLVSIVVSLIAGVFFYCLLD